MTFVTEIGRGSDYFSPVSPPRQAIRKVAEDIEVEQLHMQLHIQRARTFVVARVGQASKVHVLHEGQGYFQQGWDESRSLPHTMMLSKSMKKLGTRRVSYVKLRANKPVCKTKASTCKTLRKSKEFTGEAEPSHKTKNPVRGSRGCREIF